jgi:hypothetical protein
MNPILGWALAAALLFVSWRAYDWQGVIFAVTVVVFWLLLQFGRSLRAMRNAGQAPVGHIESAVMFNARLQRGMTMLQVIGMTRSLGRKLDAGGDSWAWQDAGGSVVSLHFQRGKLASFTLERPADAETATPAP